MTIALGCRCGAVQGEIDPAAVYTRATCYCRDCQTFARALGRGDDVLDAQGGTGILPMLPAGIRITTGIAALACLSLGPKGLLRWHSACCDTPIANTPRDPRMPYAGVFACCVAGGPETLDAAFGRSRIALHAGSALGNAEATPLRTGRGVLRILWGMLLAGLRGRHRDNPFFLPGTRQPVSAPRVLTREERAQAAASGP